MSSCGEGHCITCSDEATEMYVVESAQKGLAVCRDEDGTRAEVMTDLVGSVDAGDTVLVHAGVAIARLA